MPCPYRHAGILAAPQGIAEKSLPVVAGRLEQGNMVKRSLIVTAAVVAFVGLVPALVPPASAQSLSPTTIGLYPPQAGELAFADLRTLRQSPHYAQLRTELLPERLRQLEAFAQALGIDLETQAQQMSWVLVAPSPGGSEELLSIIEGTFAPATALERAKASKIAVADVSGVMLIGSGK